MKDDRAVATAHNLKILDRGLALLEKSKKLLAIVCRTIKYFELDSLLSTLQRRLDLLCFELKQDPVHTQSGSFTDCNFSSVR